MLTACGTNKAAQLRDAAREKAQAEAVPGAIAAAKAEVAEARRVEPLPAECNRRERSGVRRGDTFDVIGKKVEAALVRANDGKQSCYRLSERNRLAREPQ